MAAVPNCPRCDSEVGSGEPFCSNCGTQTLGQVDNDPPDRYREPLLIERIAEYTGVDSLAERLPGDIYPPYLLVAIGVTVAFGVLPVYSYLTIGTHSAIADPLTAGSLVAGVILAVIGVRYMADGYAKAISTLGLQDRPTDPDTDPFRGVVSFRAKVAVYAVGLSIYYLNLFFGQGIRTLIEVDGLVATLLGQFVLAPLINIALVVEFALLFFGIHFLLPRRIARADLELFFHDPRNMGGFASVGQLLKRSYYLYTGGVLIYFTVAYGRVILSNIVDNPIPAPGAQAAVFFTLAWALGLAAILYSMQRMHRIMVSRKEQRLRELEADIKALTENPYDIRSSQVADESVMETKERQLNQVRSTRTYPTTFTMWSQIAVSVLLPQALQLAVQTTL